MELLCYRLALFLILLSTGGFIVYVVKQKKIVYQYAYRILLGGFVVHGFYLVLQFHALGTAPVITLKAALSFFSWTIIGAYLIFHIKFKLMILGSFISPLAAFLMIVSSSIPGKEIVVKPIFKSVWLTLHVGTIFIGNGIFAITFIAAVMYLIQEYHIKYKKFGSFRVSKYTGSNTVFLSSNSAFRNSRTFSPGKTRFSKNATLS